MNDGASSMNVSTIMPCAFALVGAPLLARYHQPDQGHLRRPERASAPSAVLRPLETARQGGRLQPDDHLGLPGRAGDRAGQRARRHGASALRRVSGAAIVRGRPHPVRLFARPGPRVHGARGARYRLVLRGHGGEPRGSVLRTGRAVLAPGAGGGRAADRQPLPLGHAPGPLDDRLGPTRRCS